MSDAYVIGQITVKDAEKWAQYRALVPETLAPWGAELVFRGRRSAQLADESRHADVVVIRFPSPAALDGWFASPAYQSLIALRQEAAEMVLVSYET